MGMNMVSTINESNLNNAHDSKSSSECFLKKAVDSVKNSKLVQTGIVKILNFYIILLCTHLYHFFQVSIQYLQFIHCLLHYYCQTSVLFLYNGGIFSGYPSLQALYFSGTPSLTTGTRPPSCLHLNNRLCISKPPVTAKIHLKM